MEIKIPGIVARTTCFSGSHLLSPHSIPSRCLLCVLSCWGEERRWGREVAPVFVGPDPVLPSTLLSGVPSGRGISPPWLTAEMCCQQGGVVSQPACVSQCCWGRLEVFRCSEWGREKEFICQDTCHASRLCLWVQTWTKIYISSLCPNNWLCSREEVVCWSRRATLNVSQTKLNYPPPPTHRPPSYSFSHSVSSALSLFLLFSPSPSIYHCPNAQSEMKWVISHELRNLPRDS